MSISLKNLSLLLLATISLLFTSCETDFDTTADYKDITIVYGLLNQNDTVHFFRINKAFLGDGNALEYARIEDSNSYGNKINVKLIGIDKSGNEVQLVQCDTITVNTIDSGLFYYPSHLMYKGLGKLDPANKYKLVITNNESGKIVQAETSLCNDFEVTQPNFYTKNLGFKRNNLNPQNFTWRSGVNGKRYKLVLHFYFKEKSADTDTITRIIDWVFPEQITNSLRGNEAMSVSYKNESFYALCNNLIPYADAAKEEKVHGRVAEQVVMEFIVTGTEFSTYVDVNGETSGLLTEKPVYTNIQNGLGVFSSAFKKFISLKIDDNTKIDLFNTTEIKFAEPYH